MVELNCSFETKTSTAVLVSSEVCDYNINVLIAVHKLSVTGPPLCTIPLGGEAARTHGFYVKSFHYLSGAPCQTHFDILVD